MRIRACLLVVFIALLWLGFESIRPKAFVDGGPFAYISNVNDGTVSVIDITSNTVVDTVSVGPIPIAVAVNSSGTRVYVTSNGSNSLSIIDTTTTPQSVSSVPVGSGPYGVAINSTGTRAYVTNYNDATVSVVNTADNSVMATIPVGSGPRGVVVSYNNNFVYTANFLDNSVTVINATNNSVVTNVAVGSGPYGINITPDNSKVYVANNGENTVSVISTATNSVSSTITVGNNPIGLGITPSGDRVYCADDGDNTVTVIDIASDTVIGSPITVGAQPDGVTVSPDGAFAYVVNFGGDSVSVINTATNTVLATIPVGSAPSALGSFIGPITSNLQLSAPTYTVSEVDGSLEITVNRVGNINSEVAVNYATSNGTALAGSDYTAASGTVTIPSGQSSASFNIAITNDTAIENDETFNITLSNPSNNATLGAQVTAVVTIQSEDLPQPGQLQFALTSIDSTEAGGNVNIEVTRANGSDGAVTVDYAVTGGTATGSADFTLAAGSLTFADGVTSQNITLNISEDTLVEGSENIVITLSNAGGGATLGANTATTINIADNDTAANLTASVTSLNFGDISVNTSKALTVTLSNTGTNSLTFSTPFSITGSNASEFSVNALNSVTLAGNSSVDLTVNFNPTSTGTKTASLAITTTDANSVSVDLSGIANVPSNLTASVTNLAFGDVLVNNTKALTVTLTNTGTVALNLTQPFSITGSNASEFSVNTLNNTTLAGGSSVDLTVNFNPTTAGNKSAALVVTSDANNVTIDLTGVAGTPGSLSAATTTASFGNVLVGNNKTVKVTLTNTGTNSLTLTPPFSITGNNASEFSVDALNSTTLAGGSSVELSINFNPTTAGNKSAALVVTSDANNVTINLTGVAGTPGNLTASVNSIDFGKVLVGNQKSLTVTLTNTGTNSLTLTPPFSITGSNASEFSVGTLNNLTLNGNSSVALTITLNSTTSGAKSAALVVTSDANNVTINLTGNGGSAGNLSCTISSLDFGSVTATGQKSLTVTLNNSGENSLTLQQPFIISGANAAEFSVNTLANTTLAGNSSVELTVNFAPTTEGTKSAQLSIASSVNGININLIGTGQPAIINQLTPNVSAIDFGSVVINTTKQFTLRVTNNSNTTVTFSNPAVLSGANASAFVATSFNPISLTAGSSGTVTVSFQPKVAGQHSATMTLNTNIGQMNMTMNGNGSTMYISNKNLNFGLVQLSGIKELTFSIANRGTSTMAISPLQIGGDNADQFSVVRITSTTIAPNTSASVTVRYAPTAIGDKAATLTISDGTQTETVNLTGTTPTLTFSANSFDFGSIAVGATSEAELIITNQGSSNVIMNNITVTGASASSYVITQRPANAVAGGGSTSAKITFKPTTSGVKNAVLTLTTSQGTFTFNLSGIGAR